MPACTVILCTRNPPLDRLRRVLEALRAQTLPLSDWALRIVDSASTAPLADELDLPWHPDARCLREDIPGHLRARLTGARASSTPLLVYVDDDNVLHPDFLRSAREIADTHPRLGVWSGQCHPEFETPPPEWTRPLWGMLALWEFEKDEIHPTWTPEARLPVGAGLCVRASLLVSFEQVLTADPTHALLGRRAGSLMSGDDEDLVLHAFREGWGAGRFSRLHLQHLIPPQRLERRYLLDLAEAMAASRVVLAHLYPEFRYQPEAPRRPHWLRRLRHTLRLPSWDRSHRLAQLRGEHHGHQLLGQNHIQGTTYSL